MRCSLHKHKLFRTKNGTIYIEISVRGLTDATLPFPEGHVCACT